MFLHFILSCHVINSYFINSNFGQRTQILGQTINDQHTVNYPVSEFLFYFVLFVQETSYKGRYFTCVIIIHTYSYNASNLLFHVYFTDYEVSSHNIFSFYIYAKNLRNIILLYKESKFFNPFSISVVLTVVRFSLSFTKMMIFGHTWVIVSYPFSCRLVTYY